MHVNIKKLTVGPIEENCYIVYREGDEAKTCFMVDPGAEGAHLLNALKSLSLTPEAILLTHGHFDHICAVEWIRKEFPGVRVYACREERDVLEDPSKSMLDQFPGTHILSGVDYLTEGTCFEPAGIPVKLIATPGHTKGSCCYYLEEEKVLFSGDTLFLESVGRTDFPTGSGEKIRESVLGKLKPLPEETKVYPGHGESTDIGHEKKFNFCMLGF